MGAIDCGTNSTRLLVVGPDGSPQRREMRITRLGEGVDATGALAPAAMARTLAVLAEYRRAMDSSGVGPVRASATSAVRDAANRDEFLSAAAEVVGVEPELLSGEEEGSLSFFGATADLDPSGAPYLIVDVGGGSTELVLGPPPGARRAAPVAAVSIDVGCVRVTERFLHHDPPTSVELASARRAVAAEIGRGVASLPGAQGAHCLVGLAGTVTTLAAMALGLERYDRDLIHHAVLTRAEVGLLLVGLSGEDRSARLGRPGLEPARADVIVGGAVVLDAVMTGLGMDRCLVSEADILDGLAMSLLDGVTSPR